MAVYCSILTVSCKAKLSHNLYGTTKYTLLTHSYHWARPTQPSCYKIPMWIKKKGENKTWFNSQKYNTLRYWGIHTTIMEHFLFYFAGMMWYGAKTEHHFSQKKLRERANLLASNVYTENKNLMEYQARDGINVMPPTSTDTPTLSVIFQNTDFRIYVCYGYMVYSHGTR